MRVMSLATTLGDFMLLAGMRRRIYGLRQARARGLSCHADVCCRGAALASRCVSSAALSLFAKVNAWATTWSMLLVAVGPQPAGKMDVWLL